MEVKTTYNYKMLNVMKFICAIFVVMIHTMAFHSINENLWVATSMGICRIAVPFFFMVSGYFYYNLKVEKDRKKRILAYLKIYLKCVLLEMILVLPMTISLFKNLPFFVVVFRCLTVGVTGTLWYISSMVLGLFILEIFTKRKLYISLVILSIIGFIFGLMGDSYAGLFIGTSIEKATMIYRNIFLMMQVGLTMSLPFLSIGYFINKLKLIEKIKNINIMTSVFLVIFLLETFVLYKLKIAIDLNMVISMLVFAPLVFIWLLRSSFDVSDKVSEITKRGSFLVYILHQPILLMLYSSNIPVIQNSFIKFLITIGIAFILTAFCMFFKVDKFLLKK